VDIYVCRSLPPIASFCRAVASNSVASLLTHVAWKVLDREVGSDAAVVRMAPDKMDPVREDVDCASLPPVALAGSWIRVMLRTKMPNAAVRQEQLILRDCAGLRRAGQHEADSVDDVGDVALRRIRRMKFENFQMRPQSLARRRRGHQAGAKPHQSPIPARDPCTSPNFGFHKDALSHFTNSRPTTSFTLVISQTHTSRLISIVSSVPGTLLPQLCNKAILRRSTDGQYWNLLGLPPCFSDISSQERGIQAQACVVAADILSSPLPQLSIPPFSFVGGPGCRVASLLISGTSPHAKNKSLGNMCCHVIPFPFVGMEQPRWRPFENHTSSRSLVTAVRVSLNAEFKVHAHPAAWPMFRDLCWHV